MFYKATPLLFALAKELRNNVTEAEMILWNYLRTKPLGYKFRRQHPIGQYIADFFCYKLHLVIEADGSVHDSDEARKYDQDRDRNLEEADIRVLRISNSDIFRNLTAVIGIIEKTIKERIPLPPAPYPLTP